MAAPGPWARGKQREERTYSERGYRFSQDASDWEENTKVPVLDGEGMREVLGNKSLKKKKKS